MLRYALFPVMLLLTSCYVNEVHSDNFEGQQSVVGYFIQENMDEPNCVVRFHLGEMGKEEIYNLVKKNLPELTADNAYFVTRIQFGTSSSIDIGSPTWCSGLNQDKVGAALLRDSLPPPQRVGDLKSLPVEDLLSLFNLESFDLEDPDIKNTQCVVEKSLDRLITFEDIFKLRYRYAIPVAYHQWSDTKSLILFDSQCENGDYFAEEIERLIFHGDF